MIFGGLEKFSLIDYPGKSSAIAFTVGCNFLCPYCHNPELINRNKYSATVTEKEIFKFLTTRIGKLDALTITGGEPTLHKDIVHFIKNVKKMGFLVKLDSNGTNPQVLKEVLDKKLVDYIAMDIKAPLEKYNVVIRKQVAIDSIQESIDLLKNSNIDYEFRTTIVKSLLSKEDILEIGNIVEGAKRYYLQKFVPTKVIDLKYLDAKTYSDAEFEDLRHSISKKVDICGVR